jgi:hypothetical protein
MGQPNYTQVEELIGFRETFKHGRSMSAETKNGEYVIWSYSTVIARYDFDAGKWWINPNKYSVTTSKQQNIIRRVASRDGWEAPLTV